MISLCVVQVVYCFLLRQKTANEMRISDWSSDVCSSDLAHRPQGHKGVEVLRGDLEPTRAPLAERRADHEEFVARRCELVVAPASVGLGCRHDDIEIGRASCRERGCQYV